MPHRHRGTTAVVAVIAAFVVLGSQSGMSDERTPGGAGRGDVARADHVDQQADRGGDRVPSRGTARGEVVLAFAGDIHFEGGVTPLLDDPQATLGPLSEALRESDLAVVNLESAVTDRGRPTRKELEDPFNRYWFRSPPRALDLLARSGVDVASVANNHGADYGRAGLRGTLQAARRSPVAVLGVGRDTREAFRPHRVTIGSTAVAVIAADAAQRESRDTIWGATASEPGIAAARSEEPTRLLQEVRRADASSDIVVVYLHWGEEGASCPSGSQLRLAEQLSEAGADVVVGAHSHTLLGSGLMGDTYVNYGLGNFLWYHNSTPETGVLQLRFVDGKLAGEEWVPGRIPKGGGQPRAMGADAAAAATARWRATLACSGLERLPEQPAAAASEGDDAVEALPPFESSVRRIDPALERRMRSSHDPAVCPAPLSAMRYLQVSHVDFEGRQRTGEIVVAAEYAEDLVGVFRQLYDARWPIERMRLVSDYGSDDDRSMAANNSSGFNCRTVAGQTSWSRHAYGAAIDLNPVQNPYLTADGILPPAGRSFARVDRSAGSAVGQGVIAEGDVVVRAFERIGWMWGGRWSEADYQHFNAP